MIQRILFIFEDLIKALFVDILNFKTFTFKVFNVSLNFFFPFDLISLLFYFYFDFFFDSSASFYKILMKNTNSIIFLLFMTCFLLWILKYDSTAKKTRPLGGNSSNHLTVITAEHHINLLAHGEVTHSSSQKDNKKRCCDVEEDFPFFPFAQHVTRYTSQWYIFYATYVFCFSFFASFKPSWDFHFNICCATCTGNILFVALLLAVKQSCCVAWEIWIRSLLWIEFSIIMNWVTRKYQ